MRQAKTILIIEEAISTFKVGEEMLKSLINERSKYKSRAFSIHSYIFEKLSFSKKFHLEISKEVLREMMDYLNELKESYTEDKRYKGIKKYFISYLKEHNKLSIIRVNLEDLDEYMRFSGAINEDEIGDDLDPEE